MSETWYLNGLDQIAEQNLAWLTDTIKCALVTGAYVPNFVTDENYDDITNEIPAGDGYIAGGATLTGKLITADGGDFRIEFSADDITDWNAASGASFTGTRALVIYHDTGVDATSTLICYIDLGASKGAPFAWEWNANGICSIGRC